MACAGLSVSIRRTAHYILSLNFSRFSISIFFARVRVLADGSEPLVEPAPAPDRQSSGRDYRCGKNPLAFSLASDARYIAQPVHSSSPTTTMAATANRRDGGSTSRGCTASMLGLQCCVIPSQFACCMCVSFIAGRFSMVRAATSVTHTHSHNLTRAKIDSVSQHQSG